MKLSIIIVNWNGRHLLGPCLASIGHPDTASTELIVVDNGSEDGSVQWIRKMRPDINLIALEMNEGFCGGNAHGLRKARGELVMLLNTDTETAPGTLAALVSAADAHPEAGSFACRMVRSHERGRMDNAGISVGLSGRASQVGAGEDVTSHSAPGYVFGASGGAVVYRRSMLNRVGFLDESFFSHVEDVDLAWRAQLAGYRCRYVPDAVVYHIGAASSRHVSEQVLYRIQRNTTWAFLKNTPGPLLLLLAPLHVAYGLYWLARAARLGQGTVVARAKRDALRAWPAVARKRRDIQQLRTRSSLSVLKAHFAP